MMTNQDNKSNLDRIQVLDSLTASQIAAGEVVERPVSVVKELVENAIDAGASRIDIRIETDATSDCVSKIEISDNGCGMSKNDMVNAFRRHATSKIRSISDLDSIHSLGFRGEALPSIASVSRIKLRSRARGAQTGWQGENHGEQLVITQEIGMPEGTTISVSDLFYQTPARRKFLKSAVVELGHISALVGNLILSAPEVAFSLKVNNRVVLHSAGKGSLTQAVIAVYGAETAAHLAKVEYADLINVRGFVSVPPFARSSRKYYHFFVNGRLVKSRELGIILETAYATLLPEKRYPFAVLYIDIDPAAIDINVHPAKTEIRFRQLALVKDQLLQALDQALKSELTVKQTAEPIVKTSLNLTIKFQPEPEDKHRIGDIAATAPKSEQVAKPVQPSILEKSDRTLHLPENSHWQVAESLMGLHKRPESSNSISAQIYQTMVESEPTANVDRNSESLQSEKQKDCAQNNTSRVDFAANKLQAEQTELFQAPDNIFAVLQPLGQLGGSYIIATYDQDLYIVDQHAAHERLLYERFAQEFEESAGIADMLAVPLTCELGPLQKELLFNHLEAITDFGFVVEYLGDDSFVLRAVPLWYSKAQDNDNLRRSDIFKQSTIEFFLNILDCIIEHADSDGGKIRISSLNQEELFTAACKNAIKANAFLTAADMNWLFAQLALADKPQTCPHGRPTLIKITDAEIRRRFLRS